MKKVIVGLLLLGIVLGVYFGLPSSKVESTTLISINDVDIEIEDEDVLPILEEIIEEKEENLSTEDIDKALEREKDLDIPEEVEPEMVTDVHDIMVETEMAEVEKNFPSKKGINPVAAIEMPKNSVSKLNVGDKVSLPYMGTGQFDAEITAKKTHKNGSVTVSGKLTDSNSEYSVVLTEGKNMTFGTVTTPNGSYEIETRDGQGYVYSTDEIDREWIDHSQNDTLVPTS